MMMSHVQAKQVHFAIPWTWRDRAACKVTSASWILTDCPDEVTCARCRATKAWLDAHAKRAP